MLQDVQVFPHALPGFPCLHRHPERVSRLTLEVLRFASQELLAKAKKAKELQGDDFCSNGTWHLSTDFKAQSRLVSTRFFLVSVCGLRAKSSDDNSAGHWLAEHWRAVQHPCAWCEPQDVSKWQLLKRIWTQFLRGVSTQHHSKFVPAFSVICLFYTLFLIICCDFCKFLSKTHDSHNFQDHIMVHQSRLRSRVHVCPSWQQKIPREASRSSWRSTFGSPRRSTSTETSRWSLCSPWRCPASSWKGMASWSRAPCCASRAARTTTAGKMAAPCGWVETSTSVGTSTFSTPGPLRVVDPWAEVLLFFAAWASAVCQGKLQEKMTWFKLAKGIELSLN